jgi:hypothetical protein
MTASSTKSLLDVMLRAPRAGHPHLAPFNSHALLRQRESAMQNLQGLMAYQTFLADARAVKAKRKRVEKTFERQVQRQSREALADATLLFSSAMSATAQVNQTDFWQALLRETSTGLDSTGPATAQELWSDLRGRPDVMSALANLGFTEKMAKITDETIAGAHATMRGAAGNVEFAVRMPGSADEFRTILSSKRRRPRSVLDLMASPSFDQLHASFLRGDRALPAIGGAATQCMPGDVVAAAAFASRQILVEHVRKLEDTGLATYAGEDPATAFVVLFLVGVALYLAGLAISSLCDPNAEVVQPEAVCVAGGILTMLGVLALVTAAMLISVIVLTGLGITSMLLLVAVGTTVGGGFLYLLMLTADLAGALDHLPSHGFEGSAPA